MFVYMSKVKTTLFVIAVLLKSGVSGVPANFFSDICLHPGNPCTCETSDHPKLYKVHCIFRTYHKNLEVRDHQVPPNVTDIVIQGAAQVTFYRYAFDNAENLQRIVINASNDVLFMPHSAMYLQSPSFRLEIYKANYVRFAPQSFRANKAGISIQIENCAHVELAGHMFTNVQAVNLTGIARLDLGQGAFQLDSKAIVSHHGPELIIDWNEVEVATLPRDTFATSAARITLRNTRIGTVEPGAFNATSINHLTLYNTDIGHIKTDAFKDGIFIEQFDVIFGNINELEEGAIRAGISSFTLYGTKIDHISRRAIDISAAAVNFSSNVIKNCDAESMKINKFNTFILKDNTFWKMGPLAFDIHPDNNQARSSLLFAKNNISLTDFSSAPFHHNISVDINSYGNVYGVCHCDMIKWMPGGHASRNDCVVADLDNTCSYKGRHIKIEMFEMEGCKKKPPQHRCFNHVDDKKTDIIELETNTSFLKYCLIPTFIIVMIIVLFVMCTCSSKTRRSRYGMSFKTLLGSKKYCYQPNVVADNICQSISQTDNLEMTFLSEPQIVISNHIIDLSTAMTANKATQSLPEEFNQEYLNNLKKRLADPESLDVAMVDLNRLYELVNAEDNLTVEEEENIYDVPLPPPTEVHITNANNKKESKGIGTDTDSLDELIPFSPYEELINLCQEYFEPKDLAVHVYDEIGHYSCLAPSNALKSKVPDVVLRGPFLRAIQLKNESSSKLPVNIREFTCTLKSNSSAVSDTSAKMINRPLPAEPGAFNPGEGTSSNMT